MKQLKQLAKLALFGSLIGTWFFPIASHAQGAATTFSIESVGELIGLGEADLREVVINVIRFVLGFMTLVAVVFIIYGGFVWLTAGGNEDRIEKAKKIISAAVIGLIVILLAWAIVIFVARTTADVTGNTL
ncbi:MAG: hypothetical protein HYY50_05335 [Candidatus Kerfeldbacteria bacterium]|nr:hypothetical protein [Candidatus Kerfeldbacteria bacterium]